MGTAKFEAWGNPMIDQHPIQGGEEIPLVQAITNHILR